MKVVITDTVRENIDTELEVLNGGLGKDVVVEKYQVKDARDIINKLRDSDGIITCYAFIGREVIESLEKCKIIARYGIGVDNIDLGAASEKKIYVTNVPDYCIDEVSDHALTLILSLVRKIKVLESGVEKWDLNIARPIYRLSELTLGILGFGKIARRLVSKAKVFDFKVIAYDKYIDDEAVYNREDVRKVGFNKLLAESDIITIHVPLTKETRHMISEREFCLMKKRPILINTSRGGTIDEKALVKALNDGKVSGAGLDVLEDVPPSKENPLLKMKNVIITPHAAFYSEGSIEEMERRASEEVVRALKGERPVNIVNKEAFV